MIGPTSSRSGKKISSRSTFFSCAIEMTRGVELLVGFENHLAGRRIDDVGGGERAFELGVRDLDRFDVRALQRLDGVLGDLLAGLHREVLAGHDDVLRRAQADQAVGDAPVERCRSSGYSLSTL